MCAASISDSASNDLLFTRVNITKVSTDGEIIWAKTVGKRHLWNKVHGIYQAHDSGYIMCGLRHDSLGSRDFMNSSAWICKVDENGDSLWWREYEYYDDPEYHKNCFYDLHPTSDGGYIAIGQTSGGYDPQQTWLLKVDSIGCDTPGCDPTVGIGDKQLLAVQAGYLHLFPNPAHSMVNIDIINSSDQDILLIYDIYGRRVEEIKIKGDRVKLNTSEYPSGVYTAILRTELRIIDQQKFIVGR